MGKGNVEGAIGSAPPGCIAIEAEDRLLAHPPQEDQLLFRQRSAEGGDGLGQPRQAHGDDVDIALHRDHPALTVGGGAGPVMVEEA
jgi:hypothetical protein